MKKALRFLGNFVLAAVIGFSMVSCPLPTDGNGGDTQFVNHGEVQVVVMNISEVEFDGVKSEWDWIAAVDNETKSLMLFNVDETGRIPTRLFYKPDKELDVGMTFVCRENGLPEMMEFNGYILYFDNFNGWTFDLAVVAPDETIEYHYGIEYDVDFDSWDARIMASVAGRSVFSSGRSVVDAFTGGLSDDPVSTAIDVVGYLVDLGICVASIFLPPLLVGCIVGAISQVVDIGLSVLKYYVQDTEFVGEMGEWTINGVNLMIDALGCMKMIVGKKWVDYKGWLDCGTAFVTLADVVVGTVKNLFEYFSSSGTKDAVKEEMKPVMGKAKINFHVNGGSGTAPAAQTVDTANGFGSVTLPSVAGLSRTGYSAFGWDTSAKATSYIAIDPYMVKEGNTSFYAVWIPDVPNAPSGVTAAAISSSSIKLSWTAFSGAGYYIVYRSTSANGNYERAGTSSVTSYTDKGLSLDTVYYYKVSAWSPGAKGESEKSAYTYATILPDVPIRVTATTVSSSNIRVNWAAFSGAGYDGVGYYNVYRSTSASGNYVKAGSTKDGTITSYIDTGLSANTVYYYKVSAWSPGAKGETGQSAYAYARTLTGGSGGVTAPVITTSSLPNGTVGTAYSQTLTATGSAPITWSLDNGTLLPTGLSLSGTGTISGTPTTAGTFNFTVRAANAADSVTKALSITITSGGTITPGGGSGTSMDDAIPLTVNQWADGYLPTTDDVQWFVFTATASTQYIHADFGTLDRLYVQVYDSSGAEVESETGLYASNPSVSRSLTPGQMYYIRVSPYNNYSGTYWIGFNTSTTKPPVQLPTNAIPLSVNQWADGNLPTSSDVQWFTFTATASTQYIYFGPGTLVVSSVQVYDSSGATSGSRESLSASVSRSLTSGQTYYIRVTPFNSSGSGTYRIGFNTSSTISPPNAIQLPSNAIGLTANQWTDGSLPTSSDEQWFTFTATASTQYIHADFGRLPDLNMQVYNSSAAKVGRDLSLSRSSTSRSLTTGTGQTYYIRVWPRSNAYSGTYWISFNASTTAPPVQLPSNAIPLTEDQWTDGNIPTSSDLQWFSFTATASTQFIPYELDTLTGLYMRVYNSSGVALQSDSGLFYASNYFSSRPLTPGQTYYIRVTPSSSSYSGTYRIEFGTLPHPLNSSNYPPVPLTVNKLASGDSNSGTIFIFTATASTQWIHRGPSGTLLWTIVRVFDTNSLTVVGEEEMSHYNLFSVSLTVGQTYYIWVGPKYNNGGTYSIGFTNSSNTQPN